MSRLLALAGRELRSYFLSPGGYIIIALFLLTSGFAFVRLFESGQPASLRGVFELGTWMLMFICPAISMRAISEERRLGTFEMLMTCPVSEGEVIVGKFIAMLGFLVLMLVPTAVHVAALELYGRPDYGELLCGYLGMILVGSAYLASGVFAADPDPRLRDFAIGLIDTSNIVYFVSLTVLFLAAAVRSLEARRWR